MKLDISASTDANVSTNELRYQVILNIQSITQLKYELTRLVTERLFADISGYNEIKSLLHKVLQSEEPIHVLLVGPAGIGKTRFLKAIEKEYHDLGYFALAKASTGAGMINHCFENPPPKS